MSQAMINFIIVSGIFLALFATGEVLYHYFKVRCEHTRKYIHAATGIITLTFPFLFESHWYVLVLCSLFAVILHLSIRMKFLKSINAIDRASFGSIAYPVSVYVIFLLSHKDGNTFNALLYFIPILTLAISDPLAALIGKRVSWRPYKVGCETKTTSGSLAFFISAFILSYILLSVLIDSTVLHVLIISVTLGIATTFTEALSRKGLDNLFIPASAFSVLYFFSNHTSFFQNVQP